MFGKILCVNVLEFEQCLRLGVCGQAGWLCKYILMARCVLYSGVLCMYWLVGVAARGLSKCERIYESMWCVQPVRPSLSLSLSLSIFFHASVSIIKRRNVFAHAVISRKEKKTAERASELVLCSPTITNKKKRS